MFMTDMYRHLAQQQRESLTTHFGEQYRRYLQDMGVAPDPIDIVDHIPEGGRPVQVPPSDWTRLHIVTP